MLTPVEPRFQSTHAVTMRGPNIASQYGPHEFS